MCESMRFEVKRFALTLTRGSCALSVCMVAKESAVVARPEEQRRSGRWGKSRPNRHAPCSARRSSWMARAIGGDQATWPVSSRGIRVEDGIALTATSDTHVGAELYLAFSNGENRQRCVRHRGGSESFCAKHRDTTSAIEVTRAMSRPAGTIASLDRDGNGTLE